MKRKNWKILRGPSAKKKIKTPRPKSHPKKSSRPITNTSNPRFRDWVKFSETHVSRGTILYRLYPFASIVAFPCRLLALSLPVSYFSSQCLACDKHGPAILSWLFSVNLYHLCYLDDCPVFESPTVQTLDKWLSYVVHLSLSFKWRYSRYDRRSGNCNLSNCKL